MNNQTPPYQVDIDQKIKNVQLQIDSLEFHQATLTAEKELIERTYFEKYFVHKIEVVKTISEGFANQGTREMLMNKGRIKGIEEIDIRKRIFEVNQELYQVAMDLQSKKTLINDYNEHRARLETNKAQGVDDQKIKEKVNQARMMIRKKKVLGSNRVKLQALVDDYDKGLNNIAQKMAFAKAIDNALMQYR